MRQSSLMTLALCLVLYCTPALAAQQHSGPYLGGYAGYNALMKGDSTDSKGSFNISYKPALQYGAVLGWEGGPGTFLGGQGRIELEYSHRSNDIDKVDFREGSFNGSGKMTADSILLNCYYVHYNSSRFSPYLGAGGGVAFIKADDLRVTGRSLSDDSDNVFAYQVGIGVDIALGGNVTLDLGYRFLGTLQPTLKEPDGTSFQTDYFSHTALIGLRYGF